MQLQQLKSGLTHLSPPPCCICQSAMRFLWGEEIGDTYSILIFLINEQKHSGLPMKASLSMAARARARPCKLTENLQLGLE
jgi:hypothetical protein